MRYVILHHQTPPGYVRESHWDLMWEESADTGELVTWAIYGEPRVGAKLAAESLPLHRRDYLEYEGQVSDDRGRVTRWDQGLLAINEQTESRIQLRLDGDRLQCSAELRRADDQCWNIGFF